MREVVQGMFIEQEWSTSDELLDHQQGMKSLVQFKTPFEVNCVLSLYFVALPTLHCHEAFSFNAGYSFGHNRSCCHRRTGLAGIIFAR